MAQRNWRKWRIVGALGLCLVVGCGRSAGDAPTFPALPHYADPEPTFCRPAATADFAPREELLSARDQILRSGGALSDLLTLDLALDEAPAAVRHARARKPADEASRFLAAVALLRAGLADEDILEGDDLLAEAGKCFEEFEDSQQVAVRVHVARYHLETGNWSPAVELLAAGVPGTDELRERTLEVSARNPKLWTDLKDLAASRGDSALSDELYRRSPRSLVLLGHAVVDSLWDAASRESGARRRRLHARATSLVAVSPAAMEGVRRRLEQWNVHREDPDWIAIEDLRRELLHLVGVEDRLPEARERARAAISVAGDLGMDFEASDLAMAAAYVLARLGSNYRPEFLQVARAEQHYAARSRDLLYESFGWGNIVRAWRAQGRFDLAEQALDTLLSISRKQDFDLTQPHAMRAELLEAAGLYRTAWEQRRSLYRDLRAGGRQTASTQLGFMASEAREAGDSARAVALARRALQADDIEHTARHSAMAALCRAGDMDESLRQQIRSDIEAAVQRDDISRAVWLLTFTGDGYMAAGRPRDALKEYERAWKLDLPEKEDRVRWFAQARLARAYRAVGNADRALELAVGAWAGISGKWREWRDDVRRSSYSYDSHFIADLLVDLYGERGESERAFLVDEESHWLPELERPPSWKVRVANDELLLKYRLRDDHVLRWAATSHGVRLTKMPRPAPVGFHAWVDSRGSLRRFRAMSDEWGAALLAGLSDSLDHYRRVRIVTDGPLLDLPLAFLRWQGRWLIQDHEVVRSMSSSEVPAPPVEIAIGRAVWVTNAYVGPEGPALLVASTAARSYQAAYGGHLLGVPSDGDLASELAGGPSVVHIATHSGVDDYGVGYLDLWAEGKRRRIRAPELLSYPFRRTQLVSIATCNSMGGRDGAAELTSLGVAVLGAGAHSVLASVWNVPDKEGAEWMQDFYREVFDSASAGKEERIGVAEDVASRAFRAVQREWLSRTSDDAPAWWAGFVVVEP
jgi:tetratricopeptide (TPR) repeat protein